MYLTLISIRFMFQAPIDMATIIFFDDKITSYVRQNGNLYTYWENQMDFVLLCSIPTKCNKYSI